MITIFAEGLGQTIPQSMDGVVVGMAGPRAFVSGTLHVTIDGQDIDVPYAGSAPGQVSAVTQIDAQLPAQLASGPHQLGVGWVRPANTATTSALSR